MRPFASSKAPVAGCAITFPALAVVRGLVANTTLRSVGAAVPPTIARMLRWLQCGTCRWQSGGCRCRGWRRFGCRESSWQFGRRAGRLAGRCARRSRSRCCSRDNRWGCRRRSCRQRRDRQADVPAMWQVAASKAPVTVLAAARPAVGAIVGLVACSTVAQIIASVGAISAWMRRRRRSRHRSGCGCH